MHDQEAPKNLPQGSHEVGMRRGTRRVEWEWDGHAWHADVRPLTWGIEKEVVNTTADSGGFVPGDFVDLMLTKLVQESNAPIVGPQRVGCDPELVWAAARATGILGHLRRLGMKLLSDDTMRLSVQDVVREYMLVERRLRQGGYALDELEKLPAEEVRMLYVADESERAAETERQATLIGNIIASRLGV